MTGSPETGCLLHRLRLNSAHENRGRKKYLPFYSHFVIFSVYCSVRTLRKQGGTTVDDSGIIELYFRRAETAIEETARKYGT